MRDLYHDELDQIGTSLVAMTHLAGTAMQRATEALLTGDLTGAERVVSDDTAIDALRADLEARTFLLLSLQQPVATDLRVLVTTLHLVADLERMGDLALHVAKVARMRHPDIAVPAELRDVISQMGAVALSLVDKVAEVITWSRDPSRGMQASDVLPRQVALLQTLAAAIDQQASALDAEGREAIDAVVRGSRKLAEAVQRSLSEPADAED